MLELVVGLNTFNLSFSQVGMFDTYFRSVVLLTNPNPDLKKIHTSWKKHFELDKEDGFMPHLSLLYSNMEVSRKKALMEGTAIEFPPSVRIEAVALVETSGPPNQWQEILRIPFS